MSEWEVFSLRLTGAAPNSNRPELLAQWHPEKNGALTLEGMAPGSERKVWWRCAAGHEWESVYRARNQRGQGCPYCAGLKVIPGQNDLATRYPEIAARWHPTRNGVLTPDRVMPATHKKFWWLCGQGHEWQSVPSVLIQGSGCPYCAGKRAIPGETDLATRYPELAAQWHPLKNGELLSTEVGPGSMKKVWWRCDLGHDYEAYVFSRVQGSGCPYCSGRKAWPGFNDLATTFPPLAQEWHPSLNGMLTPRQVTRGSHKKVWWQCREGHVWKAAVYARAKKNGTGCPVCAGTAKKSKHAKLA